MAIFNSYVKLPEGTLKNMVVFHSKLLDSQRHPRISRDSDGTPITNYHDLPMLSGFLQMIYTSQYVYVYIYIYTYIYIYVYIYIYIYARGPRFPQSILVLIDPYVKNHCFATAKCGFCTLFFFFL